MSKNDVRNLKKNFFKFVFQFFNFYQTLSGLLLVPLMETSGDMPYVHIIFV